jgi:hypothetical protein
LDYLYSLSLPGCLVLKTIWNAPRKHRFASPATSWSLTGEAFSWIIHLLFLRHTSTLYTGGLKAKFRGLHHIYVEYLGTAHQPIKLYTPFNNRECLHCHLGARSFEQGVTHSALMNDIKSNQMSCVSSGCHDMVHDIPHLDKAKFWSPQP